MKRKFNADIDPRDGLTRARRPELLAYAQANGIPGVDDNTPKRVLARLLRARGLTTPDIPARFLGMPENATEAQPAEHDLVGTGEILDAEDSFMQQWEAEQGRRNAEPDPPPEVKATKTIDDLSFMEMRQECKRRGIPWALTDKKVDLRAKLHDQDAA